MGLNNKGKGFIPLLLVILVSLGISAVIYYLFAQERTKNMQLTEEVSTLQAKNGSLQSQLDEATNKVTELKSSISDAQSKILELTGDLEKERAQKQASGTQVAQMKQELEQTKTLKADLEKKLADSEQTLLALDTRVKEMETQIKDLESVKASLEEKVKGFEKNIELGKIVVNPDGAAPAAAAAAKVSAGKILVMNKDYNFAVISLGNKDGVSIGDIFTVFHNNKPVAELKIEKVHDSMSAAGFAPDIKNKIAEGDKVELKSK